MAMKSWRKWKTKKKKIERAEEKQWRGGTEK